MADTIIYQTSFLCMANSSENSQYMWEQRLHLLNRDIHHFNGNSCNIIGYGTPPLLLRSQTNRTVSNQKPTWWCPVRNWHGVFLSYSNLVLNSKKTDTACSYHNPTWRSPVKNRHGVFLSKSNMVVSSQKLIWCLPIKIQHGDLQ